MLLQTIVVGLSSQRGLGLETNKCATLVTRYCRVSQGRIPRGGAQHPHVWELLRTSSPRLPEPAESAWAFSGIGRLIGEDQCLASHQTCSQSLRVIVSGSTSRSFSVQFSLLFCWDGRKWMCVCMQGVCVCTCGCACPHRELGRITASSK